MSMFFFFFFQAEDGIRDLTVTGVQTCALPISPDQRLEIAAGEIGPADRTREQHVACENHSLAHEAHAAGRVPRRVPNGEGESPDSDRLPGDQLPVGRRRRVDGDAERQALLDRSEERRVGKECRSRWSPY